MNEIAGVPIYLLFCPSSLPALDDSCIRFVLGFCHAANEMRERISEISRRAQPSSVLRGVHAEKTSTALPWILPSFTCA